MPDSVATSSRRSPDVRRRCPGGSPTSCGRRASRRRRRKSASSARTPASIIGALPAGARDRRSPDRRALPRRPRRRDAEAMTTYLITGAGGGLGALTARELAARGHRVVLAVRDPARVTPPPGTTEVRRLDLADLASVREFAAGWSGDLDVLVNNAGVMAVPCERTADGFETHMAVNHFGPFLLTNLLLPHVTGRVVTVSSGLARRGKIRLDDLNWERRRYSPVRAYGQSKLANLLFTHELQRRLTEAGRDVRAVAAHPGVARTGLDRHFGRMS